MFTEVGNRIREDEVLRMLRELFSKFGQRLVGRRVLLFGSRAWGHARPRSDFDVAVIGESPLPLQDFFALADALDELPTLYRIDWVDLARARQRFRESALANSEAIYEA